MDADGIEVAFTMANYGVRWVFGKQAEVPEGAESE